MILEPDIIIKYKQIPEPSALIKDAIQDNHIQKINQIKEEINTTFSSDFANLHANYIEKLTNVIVSYFLTENELIFCPYQIPYASVLINYMDERIASACFRSLMNGNHNLKSLFLPNSSRIDDILKVWNYILENQYKKIYKNFEKMSIQSVQFCPKWFLTAFQIYNFPQPLIAFIFDRYIAFGTRALFSIGIAIISRFKKEIKTDSANSCLQRLTNLDNEPKICNDWKHLIKKINKKWIHKKAFDSFLKAVNLNTSFY